ncbi:WD repeat and HMG-box DNA binding-domain containing protein 1 [Blyttiomyces sp. JEL0837]|nr:WD repeat and HMG-box DNA binding-domain containing protein 1 [Blyttiomyces sp. JEL0837]
MGVNHMPPSCVVASAASASSLPSSAPSSGRSPSKGKVTCVFSPDGSHLITASSVMSCLRQYSVDELRQAATDRLAKLNVELVDPVNEEIPLKGVGVLSLSANSKFIAAGTTEIPSETGPKGLLFRADTLKYDKVLADFTLPVRCVAFRPATAESDIRNMVAAVDETGVLRFIDVENITNSQTVATFDDEMDVCLTFSPDGRFLVTVTCEGDILIDKVTTIVASPARVKEFKALAPPTPRMDYKYSVQVDWHPSGKFLAIPTRSEGVAVFDTQSWKEVYNLKCSGVTFVKWSHDGEHLACICSQSSVYLWTPKSNKLNPVGKHNHKIFITDLAWNPKKLDLVVVDEELRISYWPDVLQRFRVEAEKSLDDLDLFSEIPTKKKKAAEVEKAKERPSKMVKKSHEESDQEMADADDGILSDSLSDDFVEDDDGAGYKAPVESRAQMNEYYKRQKKTLSTKVREELEYLPATTTEIQSPFQPNAGPPKGNRQLLACTMDAFVYSVTSSGSVSLHIEFYDKSVHRNESFQDYYKHTMAAINEKGVVFASEPETAGTHSVVEFKPSDNWNGGTWVIQLAANETARALALTSEGPVVATDHRYLRFFSLGGVQRKIECLPGPIVAMTGRGRWLFVVYHRGGAFHGDQNLGYLLIDVKSKVRRKDELPISPSSTLEWIGLSDALMPLTYDSCGVMRMLHCDEWLPVFDSRVECEGKQIYYWPVGVMDNTLVYVLCKGLDRHPVPVMQHLQYLQTPLKMPVLGGAVDEEQ